MKKRILVGGVCLLFVLFYTLGCEKKSKEEKTVSDVTKQVDKAAKDVKKEAEKAAEKADK